MNIALSVFILLAASSAAWGANLVCYYDSSSHDKTGLAQFTLNDLDVALQFCTHVVYGYMGLMPDTYEMTSINPSLDIQRRHLSEFTALKEKNPSVKFLLSVGGEHENTQKYIELLESGRLRQDAFVRSARNLVRSYNFDGLDLAFPMPTNKPRKVHSRLGTVWKSIKKLVTGNFIVDEKAEEHKQQFTDLIADLKNALRNDNLLLSLTVLPNVNSSWYFDAPAIINNLDLINLATFDFLTPQRNPEEADFTAPLYEDFNPEKNRLPHYNANFQLEHWTQQRVPSNKLNMGIATYGRAWKLTTESGNTGVPVVPNTAGPAPAGPQTGEEGLLSWAEICAQFNTLRRVNDPLKRFGIYAFRPANENNENGMWVSFDDPDMAATKAAHAKAKNLGGVALFNINLDDFRGQCSGDKYPLLRAIKYRLL